MNLHRPLPQILLVVLLAAALWQLRVVAPIQLPQKVGSANGDLYSIYVPLYSFFYRGADFMPGWNPYQMAGTPTVGYLAGGLYYPPHLLYAVLPVHVAMGVLGAFHLALAGAGTVLLARALGLAALGSLVAGLVFLSNELLVGEHLRLQYLEGLSWVPLAALALRALLLEPGVRAAVGCALVVALQILTGDVQIVCYEAYLAATVAVAAYVAGGREHGFAHAGRVVTWGLVATIVAIVLAAVQLVPTVSVVGQAVRGYGGLTLEQTMPQQPTLAFLVHALTLSGAALLLVPFSALAPRSSRPVLVVLAVVAIVSLAIGCGTWLYRDVFYRLPGVDLFRLPHQTLVFSALALSLLAGFGLDAIGREHGALARPVLIVLALVLGTAVRGQIGAWWLAVTSALLVLNALAAARGVGVAATCVLVALVVVGEGFARTRNTLMIPAANDAAFFREPPVVRFLRGAVGFDRVLVIKNWRDRFPLTEKLGSLHGISVVQDYEALTPKIYHRLLADLEPMNTDKPLFWGRYVAPPMDTGWTALDLLSTRYVVADPNVGWEPLAAGRFRAVYRDADAVVYENTRALPRVSVVTAHRVVEDPERAIELVLRGRFDPRREVILDREPVRDATPVASVASAAAIVARSAESLTVRASTPRPALLVVNDLFWPGWEATIDGRPARILRANGVFRAVELPAGEHEVRFTYADRRSAMALAGSLAALAGCLLVLLGPRRRSGAPQRSRIAMRTGL